MYTQSLNKSHVLSISQSIEEHNIFSLFKLWRLGLARKQQIVLESSCLMEDLWKQSFTELLYGPAMLKNGIITFQFKNKTNLIQN